MLSFCSSPHGLVSEPAVTGTTRRQRRTSLPSTTPGFATVRRVATLGGKRSFSGGSRRGASTNLKALISQPKDFVHLTHVDGSSTTSTAREIIGIDINLLQRVLAECDDAQRQSLTSTAPAPSPVTAIQESREEDPASAPAEDADASASVATVAESSPPDAPITTVTPSTPTATADENAIFKSRRASMIKRKPVPAHDDDGNIIPSSAETTPSPFAISSIAETSALELAAA